MERLSELALEPSFYSSGNVSPSASGTANGERQLASSSPVSTDAANPQSFRCGREPRPNDVFIAVMGVTGSGKSSFISLCSGSDDIRIGHGLESCTSHVGVHAYDVTPEQTVYLIDTPGFDDTNVSDTEVLRDIASWLGGSYQNDILLHGILYFHKISETRMLGSGKRNLILFRKLCGKDALKRVVLVTTMWDRVEADEGERREKLLIGTPEFWGYMMDNGSTFRRHLNSEKTAKDIVHSLAKHRSTITTNLQHELVDQHQSLNQSSVGQELEKELQKERDRWAKQLGDVVREMREAIEQRDRESESALKEERDRYRSMIENAERRMRSLQGTIENLLVERDERLATLEKRLENREAARSQENQQSAKRTTQLGARSQRPQPGEEQPGGQSEEVEEANAILPEILPHTRVITMPKEMRSREDRIAWMSRYPKFSIALTCQTFVFVGPTQIHSNYPDLKAKSWLSLKNTSFVTLISLGSSTNKGLYSTCSWWSDKVWSISLKSPAYQHLMEHIDDLDTESLKFCALGPNGSFFARWGSKSRLGKKPRSKEYERYVPWRFGGPSSARSFLAGLPWKVLAYTSVTFGYGQTWFMSSLSQDTDKTFPGSPFRFDLGNYYSDLREFLEDNTMIFVQAMALNHMNTSDYAMVYMDKGDTRFSFRFRISDPRLAIAAKTWWDSTYTDVYGGLVRE